MKSKKLLVVLSLALATTAFVACGKADDKKQTEETPKTEEKETTDVVTTASIVNENDDFEKAISNDS